MGCLILMIASEAVDGQGGLPEGGRSQQGAAASHGTPASLRQWCLPGAMQGGKGRPPTGRRPATEPSEDQVGARPSPLAWNSKGEWESLFDLPLSPQQMPPGIRTNPLFLASDLSNGREQVRDSVPLLDAGGASPMRRLSSQSEDGQHGSFRGSGATETLQSIYDSSRRFRGGITTASLPDNDNWLYDEMKATPPYPPRPSRYAPLFRQRIACRNPFLLPHA